MPRFSLKKLSPKRLWRWLVTGFKTPLTRPRFVIWTGLLVFVVALVAVVGLSTASTKWFCAAPCHIVQADAIKGYDMSAHRKVSCIACHAPLSADTVTFVIEKLKAAKGVPIVLSKSWEAPLNAESEAALNAEEFPDEKCQACHSMETRKVTASEGIIINHEVHTENGVRCVLCHNRTAHPEDFALQVKGPNGEPSKKHENFMEMRACFRCHGLEADAKAPGKCSACHPSDFQLKPPSHFASDFMPKGHAEMARENLKELATAGPESEKEAKAKEGVAYAAEGEAAGEGAAEGEEVELKPVTQVDYCGTCHEQKFCEGCHGMKIPHPAAFKTPDNSDPAAYAQSHPALSKSQAKKCDMCHKPAETQFCDNCHHGEKVSWKFQAAAPWGTQHAQAVGSTGVAPCLKCHKQQFCSDCHAKKKPVPSDHLASGWVRKPVKELGGHAYQARKEMSGCEVCHGTGGTKAAFCKSCHKLDMPHPQGFTSFHAKTGRTQAAVCANCHEFRELCSNCHHQGASTSVPWLQVHGGVVNKSGAAGCFQKCHKEDFCVKCHTSKKVIPGSHRAKDWTHRATAKSPAKHSQVFKNNPENCAYCHGAGGATSKFCIGCHKMEMPHASDFKDAHKAAFQASKLDRKACVNCHTQVFCTSCHHKDNGITGKKPWVNEHPSIVKSKGVEGCNVCHKETYCSHCHVREIH